MHPAQSPLSSSLLFRYGLLGFPLAFAALPVYVMVPQLYGQTLGLPLGIVGAILLATRAGDAFFDPLVGAWADRHRTRLMVAGALALAVGIALLFNPPRSMAQEALPAWL